jgi:formylmethanofuran dehydrogenase subunit E
MRMSRYEDVKVQSMQGIGERLERNICSYTFEEYVERVKAFHGCAAPGVLIGGFMVDMAYSSLSVNGLYDALCETPKCLPDAVQLLTPCTIGNGWLRVINLGRFALTLYDKHTREGVRVFVDAAKMAPWPEIRSWYFKQKPKDQQDEISLCHEIREAGANICNVKRVRVEGSLTQHRSGFLVCPRCLESYPSNDGEICRGCQGEAPYV